MKRIISKNIFMEKKLSIVNEIKILENSWNKLRQIVGKDRTSGKMILPKALLIILSAEEMKKLGSFTNSCWIAKKNHHEITVSSRILNNPKKLLETLLHEAAHALLYENTEYNDGSHFAGCNKNKRAYHKSIFREACFFLDLKCEFRDPYHGYSKTFLEDIPTKYFKVFEELSKIKLHVEEIDYPKQQQKPNKTNSGFIRLSCKCPNPSKRKGDLEFKGIYITSKTILDESIKCLTCNELFR